MTTTRPFPEIFYHARSAFQRRSYVPNLKFLVQAVLKICLIVCQKFRGHVTSHAPLGKVTVAKTNKGRRVRTHPLSRKCIMFWCKVLHSDMNATDDSPWRSAALQLPWNFHWGSVATGNCWRVYLSKSSALDPLPTFIQRELADFTPTVRDTSTSRSRWWHLTVLVVIV